MPSEPSPPPSPVAPSPVSLRNGMHDLRNVLNAVQLNAFAARQFVDDANRTLACILRIEDAVQRGAGVLQALPAEETLATAATVLLERLRDAGGRAEVRCESGSVANAAVPGLVRQALCLVAVESQARGAYAFVLSVPEGDACLQCDVGGLRAPGPVALALGSWEVPGLTLSMAPRVEGWTFRWTAPDPGATCDPA